MTKEQRAFKGIWIPNHIWLNDELSPMEKLFLAEIESLDNDETKGCFASNEYFGNFFKISEGRAANIISSLRKRGYIKQVYFDGKVRGIRLHENVKAGFTKRGKQVSRKREHNNIVDNKDHNKEESASASGTLHPPFKETNEFFDLEEKEKTTTPGAGGGAPGGETGARVINLFDPELPGVRVVDSIPPQPQTPPEKTGRKPQKRNSPTAETLQTVQTVLDEINTLKGGRGYRINEGDNVRYIAERIKDGATLEEMLLVVRDIAGAWSIEEKRKWFDPVTPFRKSNFYRYLTAATDRANAPKTPTQPKQQLRATLNHFGAGNYDPDKKQAF